MTRVSDPSFRSFLLAATVALSNLAGAATITIINQDGAGEGFNDPTPAAPVGGNPGTTVGQQRLNVFQRAAEIWGAKLSSAVPIQVAASFDALSCTPTSGTLGSAGAVQAFRDFSGAPVANTWYPSALANALANTDLAPGSADIQAQFNSNLGTAGCLTSLNWYYGLDGNPPGGTIELLETVLHELAHGLGFQTFVNLATGAKLVGFDDTFMRNLENHSTGETYPEMTNAERLAASTNTGNLHWIGAHVVANSGFLTSGLGANGHVEMYAPNPSQPGSSVSHFSTSLSPDELMEPFANASSVRTLTSFLLRDIGWGTPPVTVTGRRVFYNNSAWDGNDPLPDVSDDDAIATNKVAFQAGGTATFTNYTSYSRGINGIMVDIAALAGTPAASDFTFKVGNDNVPSGWPAAPNPASITVRAGQGTSGSDRVTLIWNDNNLNSTTDANEAVAKKWLEVTVKATANTGLATDDIFYFGNAVGDSGNSTVNAQVDLADEIAARNNPRTFFNPASLDDAYDYDRDQRVDLADEIIGRNNGTTFITALKLMDLSSFNSSIDVTNRPAVANQQVLTIEQRGTAVWVMCHGSAQSTPILTTTSDLTHWAWTPVSTAPTYNSESSTWTWRLNLAPQSTRSFYRLAGATSN